jgi:rhamnose utilization protein RhaD (predicted bifunctional aldolase and dehydrogenase)
MYCDLPDNRVYGDKKSKMKKLWDATESGDSATDLSKRVYTSRLPGRDHTLVLHGSGHTSVGIMGKICF